MDIGGSGIKGAPVDLDRGDLARERHKVLTPHPATPEDVAGCVAEVVGHFDWKGPVGGSPSPGVVTDGLTRTAANVDKGWIDQDARTLLGDKLGLPVTVLNDADAAGIAEMTFGAGRGPQGHGDHADLRYGGSAARSSSTGPSYRTRNSATWS